MDISTMLQDVALNNKSIHNNSQRIYDAGYHKGLMTDSDYQSGYAAGKTSGEAEGIRAMWELIQKGGTNTDIGTRLLTGANFTKKTYRPIYDIRPTSAYDWSMNCPNDKSILFTEGQVNMKELEEEQGMVHDFSNCTSVYRAFCSGLFSELNVIDISKATNTDLAFYGGYFNSANSVLRLKRIERLIFSENTVIASNMLKYNGLMEYIGFEGVIAKNGLDLSSCVKLDKESHIKLVNILSSNTSGLSVTVSQRAVNKAFETSEGANDGLTSPEWLALRATKENWGIKYA